MSMPMGNDEPKFWSNVLQWPTTIAGQGPNGKSPSSKGSSGNSSSDDHFALRNFSWRKIFWSDALQWPVYGPISLQGMAKTRKIPSFKESSGNFIWIDLVALGNSQRQVFVFSRGCVDGEDPEATGIRFWWEKESMRFISPNHFHQYDDFHHCSHALCHRCDD